jgi:hypothetical protein
MCRSLSTFQSQVNGYFLRETFPDHLSKLDTPQSLYNIPHFKNHSSYQHLNYFIDMFTELFSACSTKKWDACWYMSPAPRTVPRPLTSLLWYVPNSWASGSMPSMLCLISGFPLPHFLATWVPCHVFEQMGPPTSLEQMASSMTGVGRVSVAWELSHDQNAQAVESRRKWGGEWGKKIRHFRWARSQVNKDVTEVPMER